MFEIIDPFLAHTFRTNTATYFRKFTLAYPGIALPDAALAEFKQYISDQPLLDSYLLRAKKRAPDIVNFYTEGSRCSLKYPSWTAVASHFYS